MDKENLMKDMREFHVRLMRRYVERYLSKHVGRAAKNFTEQAFQGYTLAELIRGGGETDLHIKLTMIAYRDLGEEYARYVFIAYMLGWEKACEETDIMYMKHRKASDWALDVWDWAMGPNKNDSTRAVINAIEQWDEDQIEDFYYRINKIKAQQWQTDIMNNGGFGELEQ